MEVLNQIVKSLPLSAIIVAIEYRFACKTLGKKSSPLITYIVLLATYMIAGVLNEYYQIFTTIDANTLYHFAIVFFSYLVLFKGSIAKKLFFAIFISYAIPITYYIFLPFATYFFGANTKNYLLSLEILQYINILSSVIVMEFAGRKFQNLKRELPLDYTIYLAVVLIFVQMAVFSRYDLMMTRNLGAINLQNTVFASIFALIGYAIVLIAIFAVDRQVSISLKSLLNAIAVRDFQNRELERRKLSSFRHDIKNHLLCLNNLLQNGKTEKALSYMENLTSTVKSLDNPVQTGNDYADALLSIKYSQALEDSIKVSFDMVIPKEGYILPIDLCSILSNALDNAISACKQIPKQDRWITGRAFVKQGQLIIEIKNSKPSSTKIINGKIYPQKSIPNHGIGLSAVKTIVDQYNGSFDIVAEKDFTFRVLIPPNHL